MTTEDKNGSKGSKKVTRRGFGLLTGGAIVGGSVFAANWFNITAEAGGEGRITVGQAHQGATGGEIFLIDIRRPDEWQRTGVGEGAYPLDMRRKDFTDALLEVTKGDRSAPVALICARGVRSRKMTIRLQEAGFTNIIDVPEGMLGSGAGPGWLKSDLPVKAYAGG